MHITNIIEKISSDLPAEGGYEKGFKDALESMLLALGQSIDPLVLQEAVTTALDAYGNNDGASCDKVTVDLNVFDDDGSVVDSTTATMTVGELSDIVDHASQLIILRREGKPFEEVMDELDEALSVAEVIEA
jgi:hypothetical protein